MMPNEIYCYKHEYNLTTDKTAMANIKVVVARR